jgi:hypothetical protein
VASNLITTAQSINGYWRVGGDGMSATWPNKPTTGFFSGNIDEAAVYPTVLTSAQVTNHYTLAGATTTPAPTSPAPTPTTQTVTTTADSYARSDTATTNYGTAASVQADGSPATTSYLRFALPAAPAGKTLTKATLQVKTTSSTTSGSPSAYAVALAGDGWTETGLTWNNRPATSTALGSLTATAASTSYSSTLSVAALKPLLGKQTSIAVSGSSADGIALLSRNQAEVAGRPQLMLTFS